MGEGRAINLSQQPQVTHYMTLGEKVLYITSQVWGPVDSSLARTFTQLAFNQVMPSVLSQMAVRKSHLLLCGCVYNAVHISRI